MIRKLALVWLLVVAMLAPMARQPATGTAEAAEGVTNGLLAYGGGRSDQTTTNFQIFVSNNDGTGDQLIVEDDPVSVFNPDWSPDGNRIAYQGGLTGPFAGIWVADADGSNATQIVSMQYALAPRWSPDGSRIAFWVNFTQNPSNLAIWLVDPDGSNLERVPGYYSVDQQPAWSPDGTRFAYFGAQPDGWGLYTMNVDGTGRTKLTGDTFSTTSIYSGVEWAPDGSYLLFAPAGDTVPGPGACAGSTQHIRDIYRINPDGTGLTKVTDTSTWSGPHEEAPRISPDGTRMTYVSISVACVDGSIDFSTRQVFAANVDGSGPIVQISEFGATPIDRAVGWASWQPCSGATTVRCVFVPPSPPQNVAAFAADGAAFVTWDRPSDDGGAPITGYTVVASPGGQTTTTDGLGSNATVAGLTNGAAYSFTVSAMNDTGTGAPSPPTNGVVPAAGAEPPAPTGLTGAVAFDRGSIYVANADGSRQISTGRTSYIADWSPDGNRILYWRGNRFYTADMFGGGELLVSNHPDAKGSYPRYSPDGSTIVFEWIGIWTLAADGLSAQQLTSGPADGQPVYSPDGSQIVFVGAQYGEGWGLYVMDADGTNIKSLTGTVFNNQTIWHGVDWSPDGSQIAFAVRGPALDPPLGTQCLATAIDYDIYLIEPDGSNLRRVTNTSTWYGPSESYPRFSPDGTALVYTASEADCVGSQRVTTEREVYVTSVDGVGRRQISDLTGNPERAAWQRCSGSTVACGLPPNQSPTASPGGPYERANPGSVSLDGSTSTDVDGDIVAYAWDFGDGQIDSGPYLATTSHYYDALGVYTVALTVTDNEGGTGTATTTVTVTTQSPNADPGGPYAATVGEPVLFDGWSSDDPDGYVTDYWWDFGDGADGSGASPSHSYAAPGVYTVALTVTDNAGATDTATTTAAITASANQPPVAEANGTYFGSVGQALSFTSEGSYDPDGSIVSYSWDFGDGTLGSGPYPTHTYAASTNYTVTLTVTDDDGAIDSDIAIASISVGGGGNLAPVADAGGPYVARRGQAVALDGTGSSDADGYLASYSWDFGDGTFGFGPFPVKSYTTPGEYIVKLTVTDDDGAIDSDTTVVEVTFGFVDVPPGYLFENDIIWLAMEGITRGCNPPTNDRFCPEAYVTRGQMAAFLVRALGLTERDPFDRFRDDDDSIFQADIERLAHAGITRGCNPPTNDLFCPDGFVTRGQMAAFLVRALGLTEREPFDRFRDDDDSIFQADIERLAHAGITRGCNPPKNDLFCPGQRVTRGQMAAFLARALRQPGG